MLRQSGLARLIRGDNDVRSRVGSALEGVAATMNYATMNLFFTAFTVLLVAATWRLPKFGRRMLASLLAAAMLCARDASRQVAREIFSMPQVGMPARWVLGAADPWPECRASSAGFASDAAGGVG